MLSRAVPYLSTKIDFRFYNYKCKKKHVFFAKFIFPLIIFVVIDIEAACIKENGLCYCVVMTSDDN